MAEFEPTVSQEEAISVRGRSVLVSAGAGSGKTRVLTERLMKFLLDPQHPVSISRFVIITFTNASAAELRSRIIEKLAVAAGSAEQDPDAPASLLEHIRRQQALCRTAQIGTIHHFCSSILRENAHLLSIAPDFQILAEERASAMKEEALEKVLNARYREMAANRGFEELVNSAGVGRDDSRLAELTLQLYEKMQCHPDPVVWAKKCIRELQEEAADVGSTCWGKEILGSALMSAHYWSAELDRVMARVSEDDIVKKAYLPSLEAGAEGVREMERRLQIGWEAARNCPPIEFTRFGPVKKDHNPALTEFVKKRREACKKAMNKIADMLYADSAVLEREMRCTGPAMEALLALTIDFEKQYSQDKRRAGRVDYADLEHLTARILLQPDGSPTPLAAEISSRYEEIMIDEYQDVSLVQDSIFRAVSREGKNLFMVGDVKQAIYRFRLADPEIFNKKLRSYPLYTEAVPGGPEKVLLRENFRSRKEILNAANSVFSRCMTRRLGEIEYDESASLVFGAQGYAGSVPLPEIRLFPLPEKDAGSGVQDKVSFEANCIARMILSLMDAGTTVSDGSGERPLQYSDIAILLRSANSVGGTYRKVFTENGIPVISSLGGGLFETREVSFVLSFLRVLDNPRNDIALLAVLSSPVFHFSADDLASIRSADKEVCFFDALKSFAEQNEKAASFLAELTLLREAAPELTAEKLIRKIYTETDLLTVCSAMPDGRNRCANLVQLITLAERFEKDGLRGLHNLVRYLEKLEEKNSVSSASGAEPCAVQILSIHRSKGLEFPVVFLCDTARRFNLRDRSENVLVHPELGLGPKLVDNERLLQFPTLARTAIAMRLTHETLSEEMRLMYVALTRAKERLFITAAVPDPESLLEKQRPLLPAPGEAFDPELLSSALSPVEWFTMAALADGGSSIALRCGIPMEAASCSNSVSGEPAETESASAFSSLLADRLRFVYPYTNSQDLPSKITATELKHYDPPDDTEAAALLPASNLKKHSFRKPDLSGVELPITAAERGIATHLALQYMDLSHAGTLQAVRAEIARLLEKKFLSPRQAEAVRADTIVSLFRSKLGRRIREAPVVHREFRFSLLCSANELLPVSSEDRILLQGVVDCCLEDPDGLVVIDYKTDSVFTEEQLLQRRGMYESQVKAYALALSRIFGKPVRESVLYFLSCGRAITI